MTTREYSGFDQWRMLRTRLSTTGWPTVAVGAGAFAGCGTFAGGMEMVAGDGMAMTVGGGAVMAAVDGRERRHHRERRAPGPPPGPAPDSTVQR